MFYALLGDSSYYLDMGALTTTILSALSWVDVERVSLRIELFEPGDGTRPQSH